MKNTEYESQVLQWRAKRYESLTSENGWLALAGLYWLKDGRNLVGSNPLCEIALPDSAPTFMGLIELKGGTARFQVAQGVRVSINDRMAQKAILKPTRDPKPTYITWKHLRMVLHEHAGKYAIRVWDNQREERHGLPPLKWFPVDKRFRINARYTRYPNAKPAGHPDTSGEIVEDHMDGFISFSFDGRKYKLDVVEADDGRLFIRFKDQTSGGETYPASRYCYTPPVENGKVIMDFNYAYSPPCAYTEYATCLFAPPQNHLPFRVEAGEIFQA